MDLKTGKLPARYDKKAIHLHEFETGILHPTPAPVGFDSSKGMTITWGMLGNDDYGDCGWAGAGHETEILTFLGGNPVEVTTENCLEDYGSCTGFNPNDPNSDQGTDMSQEMSYRRRKGILDSNNKRHKIGAYIHLEPGNFLQMLQGLRAFSVVGIGIEFPQSAMDQFKANKEWTVVKGSPIDGGHYIPGIAHATSYSVDILTWGKRVRMSRAFYEKYNDESYVFVTLEDLKNSKSPAGYNLTELNEILKDITA